MAQKIGHTLLIAKTVDEMDGVESQGERPVRNPGCGEIAVIYGDAASATEGPYAR